MVAITVQLMQAHNIHPIVGTLLLTSETVKRVAPPATRFMIVYDDAKTVTW